MKRLLPSRSLALLGSLGVLISGCLPKPNTVVTRSYLLAPLPGPPATRAAKNASPSVGVGIVQLPSYLLKSSLAVRSGTNEVTYLESSLWAERLDTSFQRTLAANLSILLPTDQIRLSSWSRDEVNRAVYVSVDRFDVDAQGTGTLSAWWRITAGSTDKTLLSGEFKGTRTGPEPSRRPDAVAATLSELTAQFSEAVAKALRGSIPDPSHTP